MDKTKEERQEKLTYNSRSNRESKADKEIPNRRSEESWGDFPLASIFFVGLFIIALWIFLFHINGLSW